ncbi:MAG: M1 family metallopeptidase [Bacteroidia bacterium]
MLNIKTLVLSASLLFLSPATYGQEHWQQRADYRIQVTLDDVTHILTAEETITYYNNSPDTLREMFLHLWPNAYHSRNTPFAEQQLNNGNLKFQFAAEADLGYMDFLDFRVDEAPVKWEFTDHSKEIVRLIPPRPLLPRSSIEISTPFSVKLPADFSRLGRSKGGFQVTQWYPKMAVYDRNGWNTMHYLDQGEFYSDFGNYDVTITLPVDFAVAATGQLQTPSEIQWLKQRERTSRIINWQERDEVFLRDTTFSTKTIRYAIDNAIDFAWFADRDYLVNSEKFIVPGRNDSITAWAFYTLEAGRAEGKPWESAVENVISAVRFYSGKVGVYPYDNVTAVSGALSAGGGMEYPTITVISVLHDLPTVILHEVGHNWFQAVLATNEREHPWMDEGINSYYENRYTGNQWKPGSIELTPRMDFREAPMLSDPLHFVYMIYARQHLDQPENLHSADFTYPSYGLVVYGKAARDFKMLAAYLGFEEFDRIMQRYYQEWKFRHPQPEDLAQIFKANASKNVDWFFDEMLTTRNNLDYAIKKTKQRGDSLQVTIAKKGAQYAPVLLNVLRNDSLIYQRWVEGVRDRTTIALPVGDYDVVQINPAQWVPDVNVKNNLKAGGIPFRIRPVFSLEKPGKETMLIAPAVGYNVYDRFMLGLAFYNTPLPPSRLQYALAPVYGFGSGKFSGLGEIRYNSYDSDGQAWKKLQTGLQVKSFHLDEFGNDHLRYIRLSPFVEGTIRPKPLNKPGEFKTRLRAVWISEDAYRPGPWPERDGIQTTLLELRSAYSHAHALRPSNVNVSVQYSPDDQFVKAFGEFTRKWIYNEKKKGIKLRLFAGAFAYGKASSGIYNFRVGSRTGRFDYAYDHLYFDRSAFPFQNFWSQQIVLDDGAFKYAGNLGNANKWLAAANLRADWPWVLPIKPYASIATFNDSEELYYEAGIVLVFIEEIAELYLPLFYNSAIRESINLISDTYWTQITWMLNLHKLNPLDAPKLVNRLF